MITKLNEINVNNVEVGDTFFCCMPKYKDKTFFHSILYGYKIKKCEVVKVNRTTYDVSFDVHTRKYPERLKFGKISTINKHKIPLWENVIWLHSERLSKQKDDGVDDVAIIQKARSNIKELKRGKL